MCVCVCVCVCERERESLGSRSKSVKLLEKDRGNRFIGHLKKKSVCLQVIDMTFVTRAKRNQFRVGTDLETKEEMRLKCEFRKELPIGKSIRSHECAVISCRHESEDATV